MATCSRCAEVWCQAIERAAAAIRCSICDLISAGQCDACERRAVRIRALAADPPPCDCAERDRVVEAAIHWSRMQEALHISDLECLDSLSQARYETNVACVKAEWFARDELWWAAVILDSIRNPHLRKGWAIAALEGARDE